jgi:hexaprenyl-diphosphate synthase
VFISEHPLLLVLHNLYSPFVQLIDDTLDFSSSTAQLGKPGFADLRLGLATGPALYAAEEYPELDGMIGRRFSGEGDVERVRLVSSNPYISTTAD